MNSNRTGRHNLHRANTERESFLLSGEADRYLIRLMEEMMPNYTENRRFTTNVPRYATETNETILFMRYLRETMSEYNTNMTRFLETMDSLEYHISTHRINAQNINENRRRETRNMDVPPVFTNQPRTTGARQSTSPQPNINARYDPFFGRTLNEFMRNVDPSFYNRIRGVFNNRYQDVVVRPTTEQILNATEEITFELPNVVNGLSTSHSRCPITLEDFTDGELVTRIRHCGHTFQQHAIANWFNSNVRCPVCRYDIREWRTSEENWDVSGNPIDSDDEEPNENPPDRINSLINEITTGLNSAIQTYINSDSVTNYPNTAVYTFTIPLNYNDASGNNY